MATRLVVLTCLFAAVLLSEVHHSACTDVVRGKVSCLDCHGKTFNLSGIKVMVKCDRTEKLWTAITQDDGSFEAEIPTSQLSGDCLAKILGGPHQIYASRKTMVSQVVKTQEEEGSNYSYYTISTPLGIFGACPKKSCSEAQLGSSKTINLPLPTEWGLAPSSYYFPFVPIIGIP